MKIFAVILCFMPMMLSYAFAEEYEVQVMRQGGNLFLVAEQDIYIQTEYCFEDVDNTTVLLRTGDNGGELIFSESGRKCDIKMIYGKTQLEAGEYSINVSRDDDNWYGIVGQAAALKTNGCLGQVTDVAATLTMNAEGTGTLAVDDEECTVEKVYSETEIQ